MWYKLTVLFPYFYFNTTVILYSFQIVWIKKAQLNDFLCISCGRIFQKLIQLNNSLFKSLIRHIDRIFFLQKTNRIDRKRCSSTIYSTCMFQGSHPANFVKKKNMQTWWEVPLIKRETIKDIKISLKRYHFHSEKFTGFLAEI